MPRPGSGEIPGHELFQYIDTDPSRKLRDRGIMEPLTAQIAKDFRARAGTVLAAGALTELPGKAARKNIARAIESVSKQLGNTVAVCRKCYIHPALFEAYSNGSLNGTFDRRKAGAKNSGPKRRRRGRSNDGGAARKKSKNQRSDQDAALRRQLRRSVGHAKAATRKIPRREL